MQNLTDTIGAIGVPVIAVDENSVVIALNRKARKLLPQAATGAFLTDIIPGKSLGKRISKVARSGVPKSFPVPANENFRHDLFVTIDRVWIDESREAPILLITMEDRSLLRDAKVMRSDFVANVSHEIRSPLTSIAGFIETLQAGAGSEPETRAEFLGYMAKETERMKNLVTDLLSLSQVEVKERRELKKHVDPGLILGAACKAVEPLARKRGIGLSVRIASDLPEIPGHYDNLQRVFINLLENAINYSGTGKQVTVRAHLVTGAAEFRHAGVLVEVRDEGEGIEATQIPRLTERFYRVDKSRSRDVGGTGLGLAIVKHILIRHRGRLVIRSEPGVGSTFAVYLPLETPVK